MNAGFSKIWIPLVLIVLIAGGFFAWQYFGVQQKAAENRGEKITEGEIDTSNWQTYRNEEFGFEVKYPEDWSSNTEEKFVRIFGSEHMISEKKCKQQEQALIKDKVAFGPSGCRFGLFVSIVHKKDIDQRYYDVWTLYTLPNVQKAFVLNRDYLPPHLAIAIPMQSDQDKHVLIEFFLTEVGLSDQKKKFLNQILSTFRFVEE